MNTLKPHMIAHTVSQNVFPKISKGKIEHLCTKLPLKWIAQFKQMLDYVLVRLACGGEGGAVFCKYFVQAVPGMKLYCKVTHGSRETKLSLGTQYSHPSGFI